MSDQYASIDEAKAYLAGEDQRSTNDLRIASALDTACRAIDSYCGRQFYRVVSSTDSATTRTFYTTDPHLARVDDFWTTTGLVVATDTSDDGTADTTWVSTDYQLEPLNGTVDGLSGWPYYRIRAVESRLFPTYGKRARVHITAKWGWEVAPSPIKQSALHLCATVYKMEHTPFGVAAMGEFGALRVPVDTMRYVKSMLDPYRKVENTMVVG